jgi:beta-glucosidase
MSDITDNGDNISFTVEVTNTGSVAGKDVVEVYSNPPYTNGGIEKASANLVQFEKTGMLEPGASETVNVVISKEELMSYDYKDAKGYVLEAGDY